MPWPCTEETPIGYSLVDTPGIYGGSERTANLNLQDQSNRIYEYGSGWTDYAQADETGNPDTYYLYFRNTAGWSKVNAFHMDEYISLPEDNPAGFRYYLRERILGRFSFASVNLLDGNAADPEEEAARYSRLLEVHPMDVCLCGIGENGHLAFNDPPVADFRDPLKVKIARLDQVCRMQQVHDGCFKTLAEVPDRALTVTVPALADAACIICSVPAPSKAEAIKRTLEGEISEECPATILRTHANARLYLDMDSAGLIRAV